LLIDLEQFKQINDTFGDDAGNAVLIETAIRPQGAVRESDCTSRLGGDESPTHRYAASAKRG
jgi:diguanylate cyclase (GGDEF)-like protein